MKEKTQLVYISVFIMSTSYENCLFEGDLLCQYGSWMFVGIYWFQEHIFVYTQIELELWAKYIHRLSCWDLSGTCWHADKQVGIVLLRTTYFLRNIEAANAVFLDLFKWHPLFKAFRVWKRKNMVAFQNRRHWESFCCFCLKISPFRSHLSWPIVGISDFRVERGSEVENQILWVCW